MRRNIKAAVIQFTPVHMDKKATLSKIHDLILEAGRNGADLIVTGETGVPTYPYWRNRFTYYDEDPDIVNAWNSVVVDYYLQSVRIPEDLQALCTAAKKANLYCVVGISEQDDRIGSATLYNTQVIIGRDGNIIGRHRKLVPTHEERMIWGRGDASDLNVWETDIGNIGGLICYENHMTLLKAALTSMGEEIHCCCWPGWVNNMIGKGLNETTDITTSNIDSCLREYAFETQNFVLSSSLYVPFDSISNDFPFKKYGNWDWAIGGSAIVDPSGQYLAGPVFNEETILYANLDPKERIRAKSRFDAMGHYTRWDTVSLNINKGHAEAVKNKNSSEGLESYDQKDNHVDSIPNNIQSENNLKK